MAAERVGVAGAARGRDLDDGRADLGGRVDDRRRLVDRDRLLAAGLLRRCRSATAGAARSNAPVPVEDEHGAAGGEDRRQERGRDDGAEARAGAALRPAGSGPADRRAVRGRARGRSRAGPTPGRAVAGGSPAPAAYQRSPRPAGVPGAAHAQRASGRGIGGRGVAGDVDALRVVERVGAAGAPGGRRGVGSSFMGRGGLLCWCGRDRRCGAGRGRAKGAASGFIAGAAVGEETSTFRVAAVERAPAAASRRARGGSTSATSRGSRGSVTTNREPAPTPALDRDRAVVHVDDGLARSRGPRPEPALRASFASAPR